MSQFTLSIVTPQGAFFDGPVTFMTAPGVEGSFGVLPKHTPMVSLLDTGILKIVEDQKETFFAIRKGVLEVNHKNSVLILSDEVRECSNLVQAKEQLENFKIGLQ